MKNPVMFVKVLAAMFKLVRNPDQLNVVLGVLEKTMGDPSVLDEMTRELSRTSRGARALREQQRLPEIDLQALRQLPEGTLGRVFAEHMIANQLDPCLFQKRDSRNEYEFLMVHLAETHDIWHVMTGFGVDIQGELGLQAFYLAQLPSRFAILYMVCTLLNVLLFSFESRTPRMRMIARGWVLGSQARSLFGVRWGDHWATPLSELRRAFTLDVAAADAVLPPAPGDEQSLPAELLQPAMSRAA